jgi:hypothetical protein
MILMLAFSLSIGDTQPIDLVYTGSNTRPPTYLATSNPRRTAKWQTAVRISSGTPRSLQAFEAPTGYGANANSAEAVRIPYPLHLYL